MKKSASKVKFYYIMQKKPHVDNLWRSYARENSSTYNPNKISSAAYDNFQDVSHILAASKSTYIISLSQYSIKHKV